jgi:hypothetical protein
LNHRRHQNHDGCVPLRRGDRFDQVFIERPAPPRALDIDDRALAGNGDGLFESAQAHLDVESGDELSRQLELFALDCGEARQRERDGVGARPQLENPVLTGIIGDGRAHLFDEHIARGFHAHAGEDRSRRIPDDACYGRLSEGPGGKHHQTRQNYYRVSQSAHVDLLLLRRDR